MHVDIKIFEYADLIANIFESVDHEEKRLRFAFCGLQYGTIYDSYFAFWRLSYQGQYIFYVPHHPSTFYPSRETRYKLLTDLTMKIWLAYTLHVDISPHEAHIMCWKKGTDIFNIDTVGLNK